MLHLNWNYAKNLLKGVDLKYIDKNLAELDLLSGHAFMLHVRICVFAPTHVFPPYLGAGSLHDLVLFRLP